jgi:phenolic acid decarboxylase
MAARYNLVVSVAGLIIYIGAYRNIVRLKSCVTLDRSITYRVHFNLVSEINSSKCCYHTRKQTEGVYKMSRIKLYGVSEKQQSYTDDQGLNSAQSAISSSCTKMVTDKTVHSQRKTAVLHRWSRINKKE